MAEYKVTTWLDDAGMTVKRDVRKTRGSAILAMRVQAYGVLQSFGKLDTIAAHRVMDEITRLDDLMPVGVSHCVTISNTGRSITIAREA